MAHASPLTCSPGGVLPRVCVRRWEIVPRADAVRPKPGARGDGLLAVLSHVRRKRRRAQRRIARRLHRRRRHDRRQGHRRLQSRRSQSPSGRVAAARGDQGAEDAAARGKREAREEAVLQTRSSTRLSAGEAFRTSSRAGGAAAWTIPRPTWRRRARRSRTCMTRDGGGPRGGCGPSVALPAEA